MGEMDVPADALYGASTQRAVLNFPISGQRFPRRFIQALALIKLAAAETNAELGLLEPDVARGDRRRRARGGRRRPRRPVPDRHLPDRVGHLDEHEHERGRRPPRGGPPGRRPAVHPNDHVNRCQSSNDTIPTALQLSAAMAIEEDAAAGPRAAPHRARREGARALAGRQDRPDPSPGRDARSGSARSSAATPARSRSRSDGPGPPRPSC